jgi:hypothetical protein
MNYKRIYRLCALLLLIFLIQFPSSFSNATILGESEFPAEKKDTFIWETVNATESWYIDVDYVRFTVFDIYNETYASQNYLFMNYTLEFYHRYNWIPKYEDSFYMAYNKTLDYLNWSTEGYRNGNLFLFPTPVNYTLIGDAVKTHGFLNYSVNGTKIIFNNQINNTRIEITINPSGVAKIIEKITNNTTIYKWELKTEKIIVKVPFGTYFISILIITITILTFVKKKKLKNRT